MHQNPVVCVLVCCGLVAAIICLQRVGPGQPVSIENAISIHQRTSPAPTCITPSNRPLHCKCGDNGHDLFAESHLPSHCTPSFDLQSCLLPINYDPAIAYFDLPSWRLKQYLQPLHNGEGTDCVAQLASQLPVLAEKLAGIVGWFGHLFSLAAGARREKVTFDSCFWCSALPS
jgi:hypothetical protein